MRRQNKYMKNVMRLKDKMGRGVLLLRSDVEVIFSAGIPPDS